MYKQLELIGEGAYGKVYAAEPTQEGKQSLGHDKVAIKYNMTDPDADFLGNIRELDYLCRLKGHPNIVDLLEYVYGFPFDIPEELITEKERKSWKVKEDNVHFVMPLATCSVEPLLHSGADKIVKKYDLSWRHYKSIMYQVLLGLEYMHNNKMFHRDIKADNVLLFLDPPYARGPVPGYTEVKRKKGRPRKVVPEDSEVSESEVTVDESGNVLTVLTAAQKELEDYNNNPDLVVAKLVDFGMCKNYDSQGRTTPRTYTDSSRPPEVVLKADYNELSDTWATGVLFFELITGNSWSYKTKKPDEVIVTLLTMLPYFVDLRKSSLAQHVQKFKVKRTDKKSDLRKSWMDFLDESIDVESFNESPGSVESFCDLLSGMMQFNPDDRLSITQCLDHEFFDFARETIDSVRTNHPATLSGLPYEFVDCIERDWIVRLALEIFKKRSHIKKNWWIPSILFHAIDLYDRYLCVAYTAARKDSNFADKEVTETRGKLLRQKEAWHRFLVCMYIFTKYFDVMTTIISYNTVIEGIFADEEYTRQGLEFEKSLVEMFDGKIFRITVYETVDHQMTDSEQERLLRVLLSKEVNGMGLEEIVAKALG